MTPYKLSAFCDDYSMRKGAEYFKFKAENLRAAGFLMCSSVGIVSIEIFRADFHFTNGLTTWAITSILLLVAGLSFITQSLQIMEDTYGR